MRPGVSDAWPHHQESPDDQDLPDHRRALMGRTPLRALIVEDSENDMEMLIRALERGGYDGTSERVETADAMAAALGPATWDLVLSHFSMPEFRRPAALGLATRT